MGQNTALAYMIILIMLIIGFVYIMLAVYSFYRLQIIFSRGSRSKITGKTLFLLISLYCLVEILFSILNNFYNIKGLLKNSEDGKVEPNSLLMNSRYIPDAISVAIYFALFWQYLILLFLCHQHHGDILQFDACPPARPRNLKIFLIMTVIYIIGQMIAILTFNLRNWKEIMNPFNEKQLDSTYLLCNGVSNLFVPCLYFVSQIVIFFQFSGKLFRSTKDETNFNYFHRVWLFCSVGRLIQGVSSILIIFYFNDVYDFITGKDVEGDQEIIVIVSATLIICFIQVVTNIIPILMCLNVTTVDLFSIQTEIQTGSIVEHLNETQTEFTKLEEKEQGDDRKQQMKKAEKEQIQPANLRELQVIMTEPVRFRDRGIGKIKQIRLKNQFRYYALREIEGNFTQYNYEDCKNSITRLNEKNLQGTARPILITQIEQKMCILYQFYDINLGDLIFSNEQFLLETINSKKWGDKYTIENGQLSIDSKLKIARDIAEILANFELLEEPCIHGHLKPENILINDEGNLKISDLGLREYQLYLGILNQFEIKSAYSPPEILNEKNLKNIIPDRSTDIYSYGMILYTLFQNEKPFNKISIKEIKKIIGQESKRPLIQQDEVFFPSQISQLVRYCWQQDKVKRAELNFKKIIEIINECCMERRRSVY